VYAADVDGDGDIDVLSASHADNTIAWYESDGNASPGFTRHEISTNAISASSVFVGDVNDDGNLDVLSASQGDDKIAWYENVPATEPDTPPTFTEHVISTGARHADDIKAADLDDDGDLDVVSASSVPGFPATDDKLAWYENDGAEPIPDFDEHRIYRSADGAISSFAADLDGDGDVDVATAGRSNKIAWYESNGAVPTPAFDERVISVDALGAIAIFGADLNADGNIDLLSASQDDDKIAWYENDPAADPRFLESVVSTNAIEAQDVFAIDVDGDGDKDILSASSGDNKIAWYENLDGAGSFEERFPITTEALGARSVHAGDLDGDGDTDVLSASFANDKIAWYENLDGDGSFEERLPISSEAIGATSVFAVDMDGDGDVDVLSASAGNATGSWFEDDGATPPAFSEQLISVGFIGLSSAIATDLDADGDQDVIVTAVGDDAIAWFENDGAAPPDFTGAFVLDHADFTFSTSVGDVDADGDLDIVAGQRLEVSWFRASGETCQEFDANGDDLIDGVELSWIGRAFGLSSNDPVNEWWFGVDYNLDGMIDGNDLAILATDGVFGRTTTDCSFICD
jgi:hypothetical protein